MRQYEMTYLVSDRISDTEMTAATGKINALITKHQGKILGEENWGRRKLAYPINKQDFATYITLNFEMEPEELSGLNRALRLSKEVVRSLIIVKDYGKEKLTLTADEVAETQEIEEVVGGERSFEAVEGETEDSYDLMAKREEEATEEQKNQETEKQADEAPETNEEVKEEIEEKKESVEETPEEEIAEEPKAEEKKEEKPKKKAATKGKTKEQKKQETEEPIEEDSKPKEKSKAEVEADRLAKLDEEIEGILGDDL